MIGHVTPEAYEGGPIGLVQNGDKISINAETREMTWHVSDEEIAARRAAWGQTETELYPWRFGEICQTDYWCRKRCGD